MESISQQHAAHIIHNEFQTRKAKRVRTEGCTFAPAWVFCVRMYLYVCKCACAYMYACVLRVQPVYVRTWRIQASVQQTYMVCTKLSNAQIITISNGLLGSYTMQVRRVATFRRKVLFPSSRKINFVQENVDVKRRKMFRLNSKVVRVVENQKYGKGRGNRPCIRPP